MQSRVQEAVTGCEGAAVELNLIVDEERSMKKDEGCNDEREPLLSIHTL